MTSIRITENIKEIIEIYSALISDALYRSIGKTFVEIQLCHKLKSSFDKNMIKISEEITQDELKIEEKKIEKLSKNYSSNIRCLFKAYIVLLTFGFSNKLLDERFYDKVSSSVFTKKCIQKYAVAEKTKESMNEIVKNVVIECLPVKYITKFFLELPVSQKECYKAAKSKIKKIFN
jgi:hypothetical protein